MKELESSNVVKMPLSLWLALAIALFFIVLPALVMGPVFAPFIVFWALCALAFSFKSEFAPVRNQRLRNLAVYLSAAVLALTVHNHRMGIAQSQGQALVSAIQSFRAENRTYPGSLKELVPKYIDHVPSAVFGRFNYLNDEQGPFFFYSTVPPFGRRGYCFEGSRCMGKIENPSAKEEWYDFD